MIYGLVAVENWEKSIYWANTIRGFPKLLNDPTDIFNFIAAFANFAVDCENCILKTSSEYILP